MQRIEQSDTKNSVIKSQQTDSNEASVIQNISVQQVNKSDSVHLKDKLKVTSSPKHVLATKKTLSTVKPKVTSTSKPTSSLKHVLTTKKTLSKVKPKVTSTLKPILHKFRETDKSKLTTGLKLITSTEKPRLTTVKQTISPTLPPKKIVNFRVTDKSKVTTTSLSPKKQTNNPILPTKSNKSHSSLISEGPFWLQTPRSTTQTTATTTSLVRFVQGLSINDVTILKGNGSRKNLLFTEFL